MHNAATALLRPHRLHGGAVIIMAITFGPAVVWFLG